MLGTGLRTDADQGPAADRQRQADEVSFPRQPLAPRCQRDRLFEREARALEITKPRLSEPDDTPEPRRLQNRARRRCRDIGGLRGLQRLLGECRGLAAPSFLHERKAAIGDGSLELGTRGRIHRRRLAWRRFGCRGVDHRGLGADDRRREV